MSLRSRLARRIGFAVSAGYLVASIVFVFVTLVPDPNVGILLREAKLEASQERIPVEKTEGWERLVAYKQRRGLDEPLLDRYVDWLTDVLTLDLGRSYGAVGQASYGPQYGADVEVTRLMAEALPHTLTYVLPALAFAVVVGLAVGVYAATHQHTLADRLATSVAHFGFSVPNFLLAELLVLLVIGGWLSTTGEVAPLLRTVVLPSMIVGTSLLAGQLRYARAQSLEYVNTEFIKLVRAKGAGTRRVARHLLRNAAIPLLTLFFTDMIDILVVNVFVIEYVFSIPGIGGLSLVAFQQQDLPVVLGATMVIVFVGIGGNLLQDAAYVVLDPRASE